MSNTPITDALERDGAKMVHQSWPEAISQFCRAVEISRHLEQNVTGWEDRWQRIKWCSQGCATPATVDQNPAEKRRLLHLGFPFIALQFGSVEYPSGSVQGYVVVVLWKLSLQFSVKWLS